MRPAPFALLALALSSLPGTAHAGPKPQDYVGTWNVTMTANYSSCPRGTKVGDVKSEQWQFNSENGRIRVVVVGSAQNDPGYVGEVDANGAVLLKSGSATGVELKGSTSSLTGRRIAARTDSQGPCAMVFEIKLSKQK